LDDSGEIWNVIRGAFLGASIGIVSKAICNVIYKKPVFDGAAEAAIIGAAGGALTALFPGSSTLISVGMSAAESVSSDIENGENLTTILVNATISAGFAAATSGSGTSVFADKNIVQNSFKAIKNTFRGCHPNVKNAAKELLRSTGKAIWSEFTEGVSTGVFVNYVDKVTKCYSGMYTGSKRTSETLLSW
jgi:hypothetical protein